MLLGFLLVPLILLSIPSNAQVSPSSDNCLVKPEESSSEDVKKISTKLTSSTKKLVLTKFTSINPSMDRSEPATFHLINKGCQTATEISVFVGELSLKKRDARSDASGYINTVNFFVDPNKIDYIEPGETKSITVTPKIPFNQAGEYEGKIFVIGNNTSTLDFVMELTIKQNSWELVYATILGSIIGIVFGALFAKLEKEREYRSKYDNVDIKHINGHITSLNCVKNSFGQKAWEHIVCIHKNKKSCIEEMMKAAMPLDPSDDTIQWFEKTVVDLVKTQLKEGEESSSNADLEPIDESILDNEAIKEKIRKKLRKEIHISKLIFVIISTAVAVPTTLFSKEYFMGEPFADTVIAIGIGFTIYRAQDVPKIIAKWKNLISEAKT